MNEWNTEVSKRREDKSYIVKAKKGAEGMW